MLMMNAEYARTRDEKAERTMNWLVGSFNIKPFTTPKIATMDMEAADAPEPANKPVAKRSKKPERTHA